MTAQNWFWIVYFAFFEERYEVLVTQWRVGTIFFLLFPQGGERVYVLLILSVKFGFCGSRCDRIRNLMKNQNEWPKWPAWFVQFWVKLVLHNSSSKLGLKPESGYGGIFDTIFDIGDSENVHSGNLFVFSLKSVGLLWKWEKLNLVSNRGHI